MAPSHLEFAAYFAAERWIAEPSRDNDERILRVLTSGDENAVQVVIWLAYRNREALGQRWWRLLYLALLWAGLSMLTPRYGNEEGEELAGRDGAAGFAHAVSQLETRRPRRLTHWRLQRGSSDLKLRDGNVGTRGMADPSPRNRDAGCPAVLKLISCSTPLHGCLVIGPIV
jgi:hypothetical protein